MLFLQLVAADARAQTPRRKHKAHIGRFTVGFAVLGEGRTLDGLTFGGGKTMLHVGFEEKYFYVQGRLDAGLLADPHLMNVPVEIGGSIGVVLGLARVGVGTHVGVFVVPRVTNHAYSDAITIAYAGAHVEAAVDLIRWPRGQTLRALSLLFQGSFDTTVAGNSYRLALGPWLRF